MLENKEGVWKSVDSWIFTRKGNDTVIENNSTTKVLEATSDGKVILEDFEENKAEQLWKKRSFFAEGSEDYFNLENSKVPKFLTANSSSILQIKGNITLRWIVKLIVDNLQYFFYIKVLHEDRPT